MANHHGDFIWYELMTRDPDAAKEFYDDVVGWNIGAQAPGSLDYRMIDAGDGFVGGVFTLTDDMCEQGARPFWMGYVGVDDIDATLSKLQALNGAVLMPLNDIPEVGKIAMVADPLGTPFYVMQPTDTDNTSEAFKPMAKGHCSWNELTTHDQDGAIAFYAELFGWSNDESMDMGDLGEYRFFDHHGERFGACSPHMSEEEMPIWTYYFRVPSINTAKATAEARGGKILHGPHEVPGDEHIIIGLDPEGAVFALVGAL